MTRIRLHEYVRTGVAFVRDHPQLWFTAFVAVVICTSFVFTAYRFVTIAEDAQQQLFNDRAGWLLDGLALFAPDSYADPTLMRTRLRALKAQNAVITDLSVMTPADGGAWRVSVSDSGERDGKIVDVGPYQGAVFRNAWSDPANAYTISLGEGSLREYVTARALRGGDGAPAALIVATLSLSEADHVLEQNITMSLYMLAAILAVIMYLFLRHARIVDFATLYKKQLEIDEMKDSFLSMASHELKSPLTVIRGYIEYLRDGTADETTRAEFLRRIDVSADELRQLIDDILDVSRIEMGRLRFSPDHVEPVEVLTEVVEMFTATAHTKGLDLELTVSDQDRHAVVRVDRGRLKQVIVNLVSNAVKYTLTGRITVQLAVVDGTVELSVRDTGVGMTADEQRKLFGKFYRVEASETKGVKGTGLGLWITKYMVEHMQGSISVESIKGEGSRFVVRFPANPAADA